VTRDASTAFIQGVRVSLWVAPSHANLTQRAQTADRTSEQEDGANDQRERDQPKNHADPYIPFESMRTTD
jgi:hypothetical protein